MLTPEYLLTVPDELLGMYDELNASIVSDMARRIVRTGKITESTKWQMKQAQEAGMFLGEIVQEISKITPYADREIREMMVDAGVNALAFDVTMANVGTDTVFLYQSPAMLQVLQASIDKCQKDVRNLTLTTASMSQEAYMRYTNLAYLQVSTGSFSYQEAIRNAIKAAAAEGGEVLYPSGNKAKLDVAIRRSVLTGVNQTAGKLTERYSSDMECDYYETTAHPGARPSHVVWQGRVFCISGKDSRYEKFETATGYGTGAGLCGWNCRHSFHPFFPGISTPAYTPEVLREYSRKKYTWNGKDLTEYECSQVQRGYERKIREQKRVLTGLDSAMKETSDESIRNCLKEEFSSMSVKLKRTEKEMKKFCYETNRSVDSFRTQIHAMKDSNGNIVGFNRSVSQKAVWANRKSGQSLKKEVEKTEKVVRSRPVKPIPPKHYTRKELQGMTETELKNTAKFVASDFYLSGKSGISFGGNDPKKAAETLAEQGSRTSLIKDILSIQRRMKV